MTSSSSDSNTTNKIDGDLFLQRLLTEADSIISDFRSKINVPLFEDIEDVKDILCPTKAYIASLTADECFSNCMRLMTYKLAVQNIINEVQVKRQLLQKYIDQIYAKHWFKAPDMLPKEIHREWLNNDQSYLRPIIKKANVLDAYIKDSEGRIADIVKTISFYENKGKAIQWSK